MEQVKERGIEEERRGLILVTGGTGLLGKAVVQAFRQAGYRLRCLVRKPEQAGRLRALGIEVVGGDILDYDSLEAACQGVEGVVHLVAIIREQGRYTFQTVNADGTANMVRAAEVSGVKRFLHVSALGVKNDPAYPYAYSKWQGEEAVRQSKLAWTIFRPSVLYGDGFGFFNRLEQSLVLSPPFLAPLPGGGKVRFQPMHVEDLARCLVLSYPMNSTLGQIYELGGPEHLSYRQLVEFILKQRGEKRIFISLPLPVMRFLIPLFALLWRDPPVTMAEFKQMDADNVTDPKAVEKIFGFRPRTLSEGWKSQEGGVKDITCG